MKLTNSEDFTVSAGLATGLRAILPFPSRVLAFGDGCGGDCGGDCGDGCGGLFGGAGQAGRAGVVKYRLCVTCTNR
ncbi:hypothetical protein RA280_08505 [Cupriavidus sp. CV2]|uniref:hypothetical protein n=1 Tax=Cupriavidus ulmosensis TaxID=3065913 RepID=UPI00296B1EE2|nr:hypothetical protein [Cupriavidus sp. CV2]MDW3681790.1 hypothetical protein [Cupriavidus sp. CV2]